MHRDVKVDPGVTWTGCTTSPMNDPLPISLVESPPKLVKADVSRILRADITPDSLTGDSSGVAFSECREYQRRSMWEERKH